MESVTDQKATVAAFFDGVATAVPWEARHRRTNVNGYEIWKRKEIVLGILDGLSLPGRRLLDVGCGPAVYTPDLLARGFEVWGVDTATAVVERARQVVRAHPAGHRARFLQGDIESLALPGAAFDAVLAVGVLEYLAADPPALAQIARVLRPGGVAIASVQNRYSYYTVVRALVWPLRPVFRALFGRALPGRQLAARHRTRHHTVAALAEAARRAGLRPLAVDHVNANLVPFNLPFELPRRYFAFLDRVNDRPALRRKLAWLCGTTILVLGKPREVA